MTNQRLALSGNYTCVSDTHTATVLLVVTVRDTGPEELMTVNTGTVTMMSCCSVILAVSVVVFSVSWK